MSNYYQNENERRYNQKRLEQEAFDYKMDVARNLGKNMTGNNSNNLYQTSSKYQQNKNSYRTNTRKPASLEYIIGIFTMIGLLIFLVGNENLEFIPAMIISVIAALVVAFAVKLILRIIVPLLVIALIVFILVQFLN